MADQPLPPPPPDRPSPARPGVLTAAAVLLIIGGALGILFSLLLFGVADGRALLVVLAVIALVISVLQVWAGTQVLSLREIGRKVGIVLAAIGAVNSLLSIGESPATSIITIAINAFIIWALVQHKEYFRP
jgi:hypothetical protein